MRKLPGEPGGDVSAGQTACAKVSTDASHAVRDEIVERVEKDEEVVRTVL